MGESNPTDLESIGRFARRAGIPVSHLRYYHELGLLEPAYVDPESGYRYYAIAQRESAEVIRLLRSVDVPVRDIQRLLADPSEATVGEVLTAHRLRLEERLTQVAGRLEEIERIVTEGKLVKQPSQSVERGFVQVRVEDVRAHTPTAERWRKLHGSLPRDFGEQPTEVHVAILVTDNGRRLPIYVGSFEANALKLHIDGLKTERPLTYELMLETLHRRGAHVTRADVLSVVNGTFIARLIVESEGQVDELDCRPSDALNIALRAGVPIAVAKPVLDECGFDSGTDLPY